MNGQKEILRRLGTLYSKVEQQEKAVIRILEFLSKNQDDIDFDIAYLCNKLLMNKFL